MADENQEQVLEKPNAEGLLGDTPLSEETKETDPNETVVPHKEDEKAEDKTYENEKEVKLERPDYIEDKFWDPKDGVKVEELSNSLSAFIAINLLNFLKGITSATVAKRT